MSEEDYIDFKKEFEDFKKALENSKPIFDEEELVFDQNFNLISEANEDADSNEDLKINVDSNDYEENYENLDFFDQANHYFLSYYCPEITIETDDFKLNLAIKKDYSQIDDLDKRKEEFIRDLRDFIDEFESTEESNELMEYYEK